MKNALRLVIGVFLVIGVLTVAVVGLQAIDKKTTFVLGLGGEKVAIPRDKLELSKQFKEVIAEFGDDETYEGWNEEENTFTINLDSYLDHVAWGPAVTIEDVRLLVAVLQGGAAALESLEINQLPTLAGLANLFVITAVEGERIGSQEIPAHEPDFDLLSLTAEKFISLITKENHQTFSNDSPILLPFLSISCARPSSNITINFCPSGDQEIFLTFFHSGATNSNSFKISAGNKRIKSISGPRP